MHRTHEIHATIYNCSLSYYFKEEAQIEEMVSPVMMKMIEHGRSISPRAYHRALDEQEEIIFIMNELLGHYDIGVSLSSAGEAPLRKNTEKPDPSLIWTFSQVPVLCAPIFHSPSGLPFGAQFFSRKYNDHLLIDFADRLKNAGYLPKSRFPEASFQGLTKPHYPSETSFEGLSEANLLS
jgi:Asp-tRNA(Asn)/Glu-tRNA(Gln) amidotransferase A subunit family amidase